MATKKWRDRYDRIPADRRARIEAQVAKDMAELPLNELRRARELSQTQLAKVMDTAQSEVSKIEQRTDLYISTARSYIDGEESPRRIALELMTPDLRNAFRVSFITSEGPMPIPSASELLIEVRSRPAWDGVSISPVDAQFPLVHLDWHEGHGFVLQCYEDEESWSAFLVTSRHFSPPSIEVELGGQALERWPRELFVSAEPATQALNHFLDFGKQDPALEWVRIDVFPRETVWDDRKGREARERANPRKG